MDFDAIVLAGGAARRMGGADKVAAEVDGRPILEHVLDAVAGASRRVVVGPARPAPPDVIHCREDPPGGGPVAALAAGFARTSAETLVVLAGDLPDIGPAVPVLMAALGDAAALVDPGGRVNYLASAWRRDVLRAALDRVGDTAGASMRSLVEGTRISHVPDPAGWGRDIDTPEDLARRTQ